MEDRKRDVNHKVEFGSWCSGTLPSFLNPLEEVGRTMICWPNYLPFLFPAIPQQFCKRSLALEICSVGWEVRPESGMSQR